MKRSETNKEFESELKKLREQAGLSQEALARLIGVTSKTVSNWERGISPATMTVPQIKALCQALGVTLDELPDHFGPVKTE
ncbi:MAG: helix-turn-helix transcriptional regulator [Cyanobacteria bacterium CRU_2_1]|nr:helix-turn-helix transcriptional regulator [Cyanobacteria bacterium RU_5_0]NJR63428.1 helix-turn-helix transcriptional regulator [Cyanobacteria bacterium CRU_2_1]